MSFSPTASTSLLAAEAPLEPHFQEALHSPQACQGLQHLTTHAAEGQAILEMPREDLRTYRCHRGEMMGSFQQLTEPLQVALLGTSTWNRIYRIEPSFCNILELKLEFA